MTKVRRYIKAASIEEALAAKRADGAATWLAGGTLLLAGDGRDKPEAVIDLGAALSRQVIAESGGEGGGRLAIGAGASFQELVEALTSIAAAATISAAAASLLEAALTMANRNTRNRATVGGNLGADKSCSSLIPILLALGAELEVVSPNAPKPRTVPIDLWLAARRGAGKPGVATGDEKSGAHAEDLVARVLLPVDAAQRAAYRRWNRTSCDLSVVGAACAYRVEEGMIRDLRVALGGFDAHARRFPEIETLFEGMALSVALGARDEIEKAVAPLLHPIDDLRASAAFKRLRGAQLVADAFLGAAGGGGKSSGAAAGGEA